VQATVENKSPG